MHYFINQKGEGNWIPAGAEKKIASHKFLTKNKVTKDRGKKGDKKKNGLMPGAIGKRRGRYLTWLIDGSQRQKRERRSIV